MWGIVVVIACFIVEGLMGIVLPSNPSIIIVGSGAAGIAAATKLLKNNLTNIRILEAENRIGGRINSVLFGNAYVDLGAEYCHGEKGNIVYSMAKDLNVLEHSNKTIRFFLSNGEQVGAKIGERIYTFSERINSDNETETIDGCEFVKSLGDCVDHKMSALEASGQNRKEKEILSAAKDWIYSSLCAFGGAQDVHDIKVVEQYLTCEGDLYMNWNGLGYKTILEIMMQKYPKKENQLPIDDKNFLNKEVISIFNWKVRDKATVTTKDGRLYQSDHVIFTPSVGVLKAKYNDLFWPALPKKKINSIKNIGFGAILKVILRFRSRWWKGQAMWAPLWTPNDKEKLREKHLEWLIGLEGFTPAENNPNILIAWFAGKYVPTIETISEEKLKEGIRYFINNFLAHHYNVILPDEFIRTTWHSNPNFRGSYSYESVKGHSKGGKHFQRKLGSPLRNTGRKPIVLFAGEATHPYYYSTVHGAIESGYREADRLIKLYRN